jgi:16S rRNA (guanine(527)-N(7))-methyltransferase RsmG
MASDGLVETLAQRASRFGLEIGPALAGQLEAYFRLLARWNDRINLTALRLDPPSDQAIDRLIVEPLVATRFIAESATWFDLGSGGGSPAIPLKLANPVAQLTMVESKARKAAFLKDAIRILGISGASVETERIETLALNHPLVGAVDVVTVRAIRLDPILFDSVRRLLKLRGRVVLFGLREHFPMPEGFEAIADQPFSTMPNPAVLLRARD